MKKLIAATVLTSVLIGCQPQNSMSLDDIETSASGAIAPVVSSVNQGVHKVRALQMSIEAVVANLQRRVASVQSGVTLLFEGKEQIMEGLIGEE